MPNPYVRDITYLRLIVIMILFGFVALAIGITWVAIGGILVCHRLHPV